MDYTKISKNTISHLYAGYNSLKESSLDASLRTLIELRVSQINGCNYCCNLHKDEALKLGVSENKIQNLPEFAISTEFSAAEKEAIGWAELLTKLNGEEKVRHTKLAEYFNEKEIVDITICISLMNAFNRMAISMREE